MEPYWSDGQVTLHVGDCIEVLAAMEPASVDAVCTDPPYALEFMGRDWDSFKPSSARLRTRRDARTNPAEGKSEVTVPEAYIAGHPFQEWCQRWAAEALRVLKPGGHLLAFGGTRTYHRLACGIEDAGFEVRDSMHWIYGGGFPKSLDVSKAIDRQRNDRPDILRVTSWLADLAEARCISRAQVDEYMGTADMGGWWLSRLEHRCAVPTWEQWIQLRGLIGFGGEMDAEVWRLNGRKGSPGEAWAQREVLGIRKVIPGVAFETTGPSEVTVTAPATEGAAQWQGWGTALKPAHEPIIVARKPMAGTVAQNVLTHGTGALNIDGCRVEGPAGSGHWTHKRDIGNGTIYSPGGRTDEDFGRENPAAGRWPPNILLGPEAAAELDRQSGATVSRPGKPRSSAAPGDGYGMTHTGAEYDDTGGASRFFPVFRYEAKAGSSERPRGEDGTAHPTVKPVDLMAWLVRLVTPPGGLVLDPFAGSGTTAEACIVEGLRCVLVEKDPAYAELIRTRLRKDIQPTMFGAAS